MTGLPRPAKRVMEIALPAIAEAYLQNLLGVVDSFFIAKLVRNGVSNAL
ncbi:hypothetical protein LSG31_17095 [Fodinisporobacter ferrooxydans]|uniref:MATE family efflux transporter n=1 Tax=Fodinisporobacter ferrooxydans TaxID=2901836 RepID=A0ABY4CK88_9BACL|nr:hypothetical protein LSG31_17095 [Alicyclobacillaceae bacterium MYW30-H2]